MQASKAAFDLIKSFEGCKLDAYQDAAGIWTIGWGTTRDSQGQPIREGMMITQDRADKLLERDVRQFERVIENSVLVPIIQNQFDALVCFVYNVGPGNFKSSTLLKLLNSGDFRGAAKEFLKWNKAGGKQLHGLTRRRVAERDLFVHNILTAGAVNG